MHGISPRPRQVGSVVELPALVVHVRGLLTYLAKGWKENTPESDQRQQRVAPWRGCCRRVQVQQVLSLCMAWVVESTARPEGSLR